MKLDTIIKGGKVVSRDGVTTSDVGIRGEKIVALGRNLSSAGAEPPTVIDARGRYVLPGVIDVHVHLALPFCGTVSSDDYDSGTRAAACGGVTTLIDFAIPYGDETLQQGLDNWRAKAEGKACIDYSFHMAITNWRKHRKEVPKIFKQGIPTFKEFMIYEREGWQSDDRAMFGCLEKCRELDGMMLVHAESPRVLDELIARRHNAADMKKYGAQLHGMTRPNYIEAEAIQRAVKWAEVTGGKLYIVHMSTADGADIILDAHKRGLKNVFAETCVQYLVLDDRKFAEPDGHLYACCPQIKKKSDQERLWKGLKKDTVCVVSTDTCSFTREQKAMWEGDFTKIPMGLPGLETMVPLVFTHGVMKERFNMRTLVEKCCAAPARIMGFGERKGRIRKGYDADIAIIHPKKKLKVDHETMETNTDWSPYQGWNLAGFSRTTLCRGKVIVDDYKFCGENGWGKFQPRKRPGVR
ncbi:MAG: dihydropyrimidinase [Phycisphaerales bacterium]|nr:dihydropyrimidinase [Phycisphaerales bacterium]